MEQIKIEISDPNSVILELASELAHERTKLELSIDSEELMYKDHESNELNYREEVQDEFNKWYEYYEDVLRKVSTTKKITRN